MTRRILPLAWTMTIAMIGAEMMPEMNRASGQERRAADAKEAAKFPGPGVAVPSDFAFAPDGRSVTYLRSEDYGSSKVLYRAGIDGSAIRAIARPPGEGNTDENVSPEEALRRERQRQRATGISQSTPAKGADLRVLPIQGDLYLQKGDGPLERLTQTPSPEIDPKFDDKAKRVAFVRDGDLHVIDLETRKETRLTAGAQEGLTHGLAEFIAQEELDRSTGYWWSPDGEMIAFQETDERQVPLFTIAHQEADPHQTETHRYPFSGKPNAKVRLGVIRAREGSAPRWLEIADPTEDVYLARADWESPQSLLVQVLPRAQDRLRLVRINVETNARTVLIEEKGEPWVNLHNDLRRIGKTGEMVWSSEQSGFRHLELRDRDGQRVRTLTSGEWPVDRVLAVDEKRREVWFSAWRTSPLETQIFRVSLDGGPIEQVTKETGSHQAWVASDGDRLVDMVSSRNQPPLVRILDRDGKTLAVLDDLSQDPRVKQLRLDPPQLTQFHGRDGVLLHGAYYAPRGRKPNEKAPLIVMLYGGPHVQYVQDAWGMTADMTAQFFAERGFAVWKMDNRGSARRGVAFESAIHRKMGSVEVRDQADGVKFAAASFPEIDASRVGVTGGSYGGYMTLKCLLNAPDVFKAGVAIAPVTDWDGYDTGYTERYMGTPENNPQGYRESSVLHQAANLEGKLLIIHGMIDENVHFRHSSRFAAALIEAGKPFEILPFPLSRHSTRRPADRLRLVERAVDFFAQALGERNTD